MPQAHAIEVLLVEDNPNDIDLTLHVFKKYHVSNNVLVVEDGAEAVDFLFRTGVHAGRDHGLPQVVLLDLKLPKLSGLEVLERIRRDPRTSKLPVVVLTSSREDLDIAKCYELGVNSYIVKPVDFEQFVEAARTLGMYWLLLNEPPADETPENANAG